MVLLLLLLNLFSLKADTVPLSDNILFGFEKCKKLSVDLEKGLLKEAVISSFDIHCRKNPAENIQFECTFFETGSNKKTKVQNFWGGSDLGRGELIDKKGSKIKFLIGKNFASFESGPDQEVCAGIFIFEKAALKQKSSSLKSGL